MAGDVLDGSGLPDGADRTIIRPLTAVESTIAPETELLFHMGTIVKQLIDASGVSGDEEYIRTLDHVMARYAVKTVYPLQYNAYEHGLIEEVRQMGILTRDGRQILLEDILAAAANGGLKLSAEQVIHEIREYKHAISGGRVRVALDEYLFGKATLLHSQEKHISVAASIGVIDSIKPMYGDNLKNYILSQLFNNEVRKAFSLQDNLSFEILVVEIIEGYERAINKIEFFNLYVRYLKLRAFAPSFLGISAFDIHDGFNFSDRSSHQMSRIYGQVLEQRLDIARTLLTPMMSDRAPREFSPFVKRQIEALIRSVPDSMIDPMLAGITTVVNAKGGPHKLTRDDIRTLKDILGVR